MQKLRSVPLELGQISKFLLLTIIVVAISENSFSCCFKNLGNFSFVAKNLLWNLINSQHKYFQMETMM